MQNLVLEKYGYKAGCDFHGCRNLAEYSLGSEVASPGLKFNICPECLQQIVNVVPMEMIMERPDIKDMLAESEAETTATTADMEPAELSLMKFNELKELAIQRGITIPFGCSKEKLIEILSGE